MNAKGGLHCHPVRYLVADDGGDPSRNQAEVRKLVEQDHVLALVHSVAVITGGASADYLTAKRIPVVGGSTYEPWFNSSPTYFPQATTGDLSTVAHIAAGSVVAKAEGKTKYGVIHCVEVNLCSKIRELAPKWAPKFGLTVVYSAQASMAQPDYTSQCQAAQSAGVEVLHIALDGNSIKRVARSCNTVNYHPLSITGDQAAPLSAASEPLLDGLVADSKVLPWLMTSHPGIVEFRNTLAEYAPGVEPGPATVLGWVSAKLFELATRDLPEPPTSQGILEGLWSIKGNDLGGLTKPLTFARDQTTPEELCYWVVQIKGGQFVSPNGGQRSCL